jgi:hypothetical protein
MTLQYASDLHLEFLENSRFLEENPIQPVGDVLVLGGDIDYLGQKGYPEHPFWDWASDHYEQVMVAPGNHEFYKGFDLKQMEEEGCMPMHGFTDIRIGIANLSRLVKPNY